MAVLNRKAFDVLRDLLDGLVGALDEMGRRRIVADDRLHAVVADGGAPDLVQEAPQAFDARGLPGLLAFQGPHEHLVQAHGIRPVTFDNVVGVDHVAAGLGHLLAVFAQDQALVDELLERLRLGDMAQVEHDLVPETGIEQMQDRMLGAADVEIDRHPIFLGFLGPGLLLVVRIQETQEVPA